MKRVLISILVLILVFVINSAGVDKKEKGMPAENVLIYMTNNTVISFGEAVNSDDFMDFCNSLSKVTQKRTKDYNWNKECEDLKKENIDLTIVKNETPVFNKKQYRDKKKAMLLLEGYYNTEPKVTFKLRYIYEDSQWKLLDFSINVDT